MSNKHRCPRRDEIGQSGGAPEDTPDIWRTGRYMAGGR